MSTITLGVDLGGTATRIVAIRDRHVVASKIVSTPTVRSEVVPLLVSQINDVLSAAGSSVSDADGLGFGASGPVTREGIIENPQSLPAFSGWDVAASVGASLGLRHRIDNDAVTAALAEVHEGAGHRGRGVLVMTLGTGVGVAIIRDGLPFRGADGIHPEAGHISVPSATDRCYCGRERCLEQSASRTALQLIAQNSIGTTDLSILASLASERDPAARDAFAGYGARIGEGLNELCTQHRPELVVLAGSAAEYLTYFRATLEETLGRMTSAPVPRVTITGLGDLGGAIGAALLFHLEDVY